MATREGGEGAGSRVKNGGNAAGANRAVPERKTVLEEPSNGMSSRRNIGDDEKKKCVYCARERQRSLAAYLLTSPMIRGGKRRAKGSVAFERCLEDQTPKKAGTTCVESDVRAEEREGVLGQLDLILRPVPSG